MTSAEDGARPGTSARIEMQALRYHTIGDPLDLRLEEIAVPTPAAGEVLVRIHCASVNPVDWKVATGRFRLLVRGGLPRTMGSDFAGVVHAAGGGVTEFAPGDRVFGFIDPFKRTGGTFAEFAVVPATFAHPMPDALAFRDAAALACAGATAVTLCNLARVTAGSRVSFTADNEALHEVLPVLAALRVQGLTVAPPSLETLFLRHYHEDAPAPPTGPRP
jgi:NADPH:quinone reductase-like Zn-dependent oxidoreductase